MKSHFVENNPAFGASPLKSINNILHTTGIHKEIKKDKKGEKKRFNVLCSEKGEIGGLTFFSTFFSVVK